MNETPPLRVSNQPRNCGLATWSLVLGILGILLSPILIGLLLAVPAVVCGHLAYGRVSRSGGALTGHGLALGGLITGYLSIAIIPILAMLAAIAIPNFVKARQMAQMNACINNLRIIDGAKQQWALEKSKELDDVVRPDDIVTYMARGQMPTCPAGGVYTIGTVGQRPTCPIRGHELPVGGSSIPRSRRGTLL